VEHQPLRNGHRCEAGWWYALAIVSCISHCVRVCNLLAVNRSVDVVEVLKLPDHSQSVFF
jgi:hypothetical protein